MSPQARPSRARQQALKDEAYQMLRDIWDRASRAQVDLERLGDTATPEAIWKQMGCMESEPIPRTFLQAIKDESYLKLVQLRRSMSVLPDVQNLSILRDLAGKGAQLAATAALEDLILSPHKVATRDKVALTKTLSDLYKSIDPNAAESADGLTRAALDEEQEMKQALSLIPELLRPRMEAIWLEERAKHLRNERTLTVVKMNLGATHAKEEDEERRAG